MSIDRIGKGGPPIPSVDSVSDTAARAKTTGVEGSKTFEVRPEKAEQAAPVDAANQVQAPSALDRLRGGQIDLNTYLDLKVNEATAHLEGLGRVELDSVRKMLRDQLSTDPALVDLVKQATGSAPPASSDE